MPKIRHIRVTSGVEWIDIEGADLRILCGCPVDIVKHLMRRGLITETSIGDIIFETGPNAILISDVMVQGGGFANLSEFPVLQMLYRQGMIIPNHPNNTGRKPLLIGLPDQIEAQLNYIYRGNYGLISEDEIVGAGVAREVAHEMMRFKLRFAFGRIHTMEDLLESRPVDREQTEIRDNVFIQRTSLNKYRIEYGGEFVDVDMNLPTDTAFPSPYPLGVRAIRREYFSIIHTGEEDGWDFDRPCMGSLISFQGKLYLIDAGPNVESILSSLSISVNEIEGIFHTHCHDDHFAGLTALINSDHKLRYYATPAVRASVTKKLSALLSIDENQFEHYFNIVDLKQDVWNDIGGLGVMPLMSPHPVETTIFKFRALGASGYRTYSHLADITSDRVLKSMVTDDDTASGISPETYKRVRSNYDSDVDLKKIDIGGGLIHGDAEDFRADHSRKIVLAHIARPLTSQEKRLGSGADFGTADVLIPASQDYTRRLAFEYLGEYFPDQPADRLQILLNNEVRFFNPHEILLRAGEPVQQLLLVLSGNAEGLLPDYDDGLKITAGALLGEVCALKNEPLGEMFRATSYLCALILPAELYRAFFEEYGGRNVTIELGERRRWLGRARLFGDGLSRTVQNRIVKSIDAMTFPDGEISVSRDKIYVVRSGTLKRFMNDFVIETLGSRSFFNEGPALFGATPRTYLRSIGDTEVWAIPAELLGDVPILRWKLFESYRRRLRLNGPLPVPKTLN